MKSKPWSRLLSRRAACLLTMAVVTTAAMGCASAGPSASRPPAPAPRDSTPPPSLIATACVIQSEVGACGLYAHGVMGSYFPTRPVVVKLRVVFKDASGAQGCPTLVAEWDQGNRVSVWQGDCDPGSPESFMTVWAPSPVGYGPGDWTIRVTAKTSRREYVDEVQVHVTG